MIPFPSAMMMKPAASGGITRWRLLFPTGAPSSRISLNEVEMFVDDASSTDLCTGGTATASNNSSPQVPSNAFDNNSGTFWLTEVAADVNAWLEYAFGSSQTIGSFSLLRNATSGYWPSSVKLQSYSGSWSDVLTYASPIYCLLSATARFYSDGSVQSQTYLSNASTTSYSSSNFAAKGTIVDVNKTTKIVSVETMIAPSGTETYKVVLATLNTSTNLITAIIGTSGSQSISSTGTYTFTFSSPPTTTVGERLAILIVRTDGTSTSPCRPISISATTGSQGSGDLFTYYGSARYASLNPAIGDSPLLDTTSSIRVLVTTRYTP